MVGRKLKKSDYVCEGKVGVYFLVEMLVIFVNVWLDFLCKWVNWYLIDCDSKGVFDF